MATTKRTLFPGSAGRPPGWPAKDGETLARYLLANHLRYVIYDHADHAGFAGDDEVAPSARKSWKCQ
jgi:hypothetical protein